MPSEAELDAYMSEIRKEACSRCVERPPFGPPCRAAGQVVRRGTQPARLDRRRPRRPRSLDGAVLRQHGAARLRTLPCPRRQRLPLPDGSAVGPGGAGGGGRGRAAARCAEGLRVAAALPGRKKADVQGIVRAFDEAVGTWAGCDWPTRFGKAGLDLDGWSAAEAEAVAEEQRGTAEETDWRGASRWLARGSNSRGGRRRRPPWRFRTRRPAPGATPSIMPSMRGGTSS